jgi:hypothetical protein
VAAEWRARRINKASVWLTTEQVSRLKLLPDTTQQRLGETWKRLHWKRVQMCGSPEALSFVVECCSDGAHSNARYKTPAISRAGIIPANSGGPLRKKKKEEKTHRQIHRKSSPFTRT